MLIVAVGQSFTSVPMLFASPSYYGQFANTGQLNKGDKVRITGVVVGKVEGLKIDGDHVVIKFSIGSNTIGTESRLAIKTDTILGKKVLEIEPRGTQTLRPGGVLPLGQSTTPYQLYDANFDITKAAAGWNIDTVKQSLNVLSQTVDQTYSHLSPALDGLAKFSDTIGKRDEQIKHLLAQANKVASVLGDRSEQINRLLVNAKTLLAAFNERGRAIDALLGNISAFSAQVQGFINDNPNLNPVLEQLHAISDVLVARKDDLAQSLRYVSQFAASLGESVASGPYFKIVLSNLLPYWIIAAVGRCRVQEAWYRPGGLLAQRRPAGVQVPRPQRHPVPQRRAAAGAAGAGRHPGSPGTGRGARVAVLVRAAAGAAAAAGQPDAVRGCRPKPGPFGPNGPYPASPDVASSPPNPNGLPPTPGIPIAGRPGQVATRRAGHTGADARRDRPGRAPSHWDRYRAPLRRIPPRHPRQQHCHPAPPRPPGPGRQLPAPFIGNTGGAGGSGVTGGNQN